MKHRPTPKPHPKPPQVKDGAMHWDTIYMDKKYYLDQPAQIEELREVQLQLQKEYQLQAAQEPMDEAFMDKAGSLVEEHHGAIQANQSFATVVSPVKQRDKKLKVERELEKEEDLYAAKLAEAKQKRKAEKKQPSKNLVEFRTKRNDAKSQTGQQKQAHANAHQIQNGHNEQMLKSMYNRIQPHSEQRQQRTRSIRKEPSVQKGNIKRSESRQSRVSRQKDNVRRVEESEKKEIKERSDAKSITQRSSKKELVKAEEFSSRAPSKKQEALQTPVQTAQPSSQSPQTPKNQVESSQKSEVAKVEKTPSVKSSKKQEKQVEAVRLSPLPVYSSAPVAPAQPKQLPGDKFFYQLRNEIDKINKNEQSSPVSPAKKEQPVVARASPFIKKDRQPFVYRETQLMATSKQLLSHLKQQLNKVGLVAMSEDSFAQNGPEKEASQKASSKQLSVNAKQSSKGQQDQSERQKPKQEEKVENSQEKQNGGGQELLKYLQTKELSEIKYERKANLLVAPSVISFQVSGNIKADEKDEQKQNQKMKEKEKLNEQISLLRQAISELRVEKLKYQMAQSAANRPIDSTVNDGRESPAPNSEVPHHRSGTLIHNFAQSVVTQYPTSVPAGSQVDRNNYSGKITKNYSPQRRVSILNQPTQSQIQEEKHQTQQNESQVAGQKQPERPPSPKQVSVQFSAPKQVSIQVQSSQLQALQKEEFKPQTPHESEQEAEAEQEPVVNPAAKQSAYQKLLIESLPPTSILPTPSQPEKQARNSQPSFSHRSRSDRRRDLSRPSAQSSKKRQIKRVSPPAVKPAPMPATHNKEESSSLEQPMADAQSQRFETDMESSMPRPIKPRKDAPKFKITGRPNSQKNEEENVKKKLLDEFEQMEKHTSRSQVRGRQQVHQPTQSKPLKGSEAKTIAKQQMSGQGKTWSVDKVGSRVSSVSSIKRSQTSDSNNTSKNFRLRKESEVGKRSRGSSLSQKDKDIIVPGLKESESDSMQGAKVMQIEYDVSIDHKQQEGFKVAARKIETSLDGMPQFPAGPASNISTQDMVSLIDRLGKVVDLGLRAGDMAGLVMKKYKNCIMLDLPGTKPCKLVWHYNGKVYIGEWDEDYMLKNGQGIEYVPQKYYYRGQFLQGKRNGTGAMANYGGAIYEGQWAQGQKEGRGKMVDPALSMFYEGQWKDGKKNGYGYYQIKGQCRYQGTFQSNQRHGFGTEEFTGGDSYKGEFQRGRLHGKGTYVWASGASYQGNFVEGCKHGQGKWKSQHGQIYIGGYESDQKSGKGKYLWNNGCIYEGDFIKDQKQCLHNTGTDTEY